KDFMVAADDMLKLPPKEFKVPPDIKWVMFNGKREPMVDAQIQKFIPTEDLKQWAADGNLTSPIGGPVYGSDCRAAPGRDQRADQILTIACGGSAPSVSSIACYDSYSTDANGQTRVVQVCPTPAPRPVTQPAQQGAATPVPRAPVARPEQIATPYPTLAP